MSQTVNVTLPDPGNTKKLDDLSGRYVQIRQMLFEGSHTLDNNPIFKDGSGLDSHRVRDVGDAMYPFTHRFNELIIENPSGGPTGNPVVWFEVYTDEDTEVVAEGTSRQNVNVDADTTVTIRPSNNPVSTELTFSKSSTTTLPDLDNFGDVSHSSLSSNNLYKLVGGDLTLSPLNPGSEQYFTFRYEVTLSGTTIARDYLVDVHHTALNPADDELHITFPELNMSGGYIMEQDTSLFVELALLEGTDDIDSIYLGFLLHNIGTK